MCTDIRQVDASGTTVDVLVPDGSKLTKYEVGTPTTISLTNPTVLTPSGVKVDNASQLDSLVITNVPNIKTYATFYKIFS